MTDGLAGKMMAPQLDDVLWYAPELPLSEHLRFVSNDIDAIHDHMAKAFSPHRIWMEGGAPPLAFKHNQADILTTSFNATDYGLAHGRVSLFIPPPEEPAYIIQFVLNGRAEFTHQSQTYVVRPGELAVLSPNASVRQTTEAGCLHFTIKINRERLIGILCEDLGYLPKELIFDAKPTILDGATASLARFIRHLCDDINNADSGFFHPKVKSATEDMLGRLLLSTVKHNLCEEYSCEKRTAVAPYYIRRVEEYMREHYMESITLGDLISAAGVSGRSLHAGFRRFRNETPMSYLKMLRLTEARRILKQADAHEMSVTEASLICGFQQLSKFTQDYRLRFGELPSVTLRTPPARA